MLHAHVERQGQQGFVFTRSIGQLLSRASLGLKTSEHETDSYFLAAHSLQDYLRRDPTRAPTAIGDDRLTRRARALPEIRWCSAPCRRMLSHDE